MQVNKALCEITGYSHEQLEATSLEAITHPDDLGDQEREIAGTACRRGRRLPVRASFCSTPAGSRCGWRCRRHCCATGKIDRSRSSLRFRMSPTADATRSGSATSLTTTR